jgi:hypothetical protein
MGGARGVVGMGKAWTYVPGFGASMASRLGTSKPHTKNRDIIGPLQALSRCCSVSPTANFPIARVQASPSGRFVARFESLPRR